MKQKDNTNKILDRPVLDIHYGTSIRTLLLEIIPMHYLENKKNPWQTEATLKQICKHCIMEKKATSINIRIIYSVLVSSLCVGCDGKYGYRKYRLQTIPLIKV